ncbi:unnamed protein product, partial [marine sediment metagenome]
SVPIVVKGVCGIIRTVRLAKQIMNRSTILDFLFVDIAFICDSIQMLY